MRRESLRQRSVRKERDMFICSVMVLIVSLSQADSTWLCLRLSLQPCVADVGLCVRAEGTGVHSLMTGGQTLSNESGPWDIVQKRSSPLEDELIVVESPDEVLYCSVGGRAGDAFLLKTGISNPREDTTAATVELVRDKSQLWTGLARVAEQPIVCRRSGCWQQVSFTLLVQTEKVESCPKSQRQLLLWCKNLGGFCCSSGRGKLYQQVNRRLYLGPLVNSDWCYNWLMSLWIWHILDL